MRIPFSAICKQVQPLVNLPGGISMDPFIPRRRKEKVVVVMGATGTGKSRLSIELATHFRAEIVNSDKMQVYKGLDIVTNKVTEGECHGVPHHLLGIVDPNADFSATDFQHHASLTFESIVRKDRLPIIAGGSNSYIEALVNQHMGFQQPNYDYCFLWIDVSLPVLHSFVSARVDHMVSAGLVDEVREFFDPRGDYSRGIKRAIGVPEMDQFLRTESISMDEESRVKLLQAGIEMIKANTCKLACLQLQKILRLQNQLEWNIHHLDATEVFLKRGPESADAWERLVARPSAMIVERFLYENNYISSLVPSVPAAPVIGGARTAVVSATR